MRRLLTAVVLATAMFGCTHEDNTMRRQGRAPAPSTTTRPPSSPSTSPQAPPAEARPTDGSPMRGDESFPSEYPSTPPGASAGTSGVETGEYPPTEYDLEAGKTAKDAGAGASDGGSH